MLLLIAHVLIRPGLFEIIKKLNLKTFKIAASKRREEFFIASVKILNRKKNYKLLEIHRH